MMRQLDLPLGAVGSEYGSEAYDVKRGKHHGVQILLERMKNNPEEFTLNNKKWEWFTTDILKVAPLLQLHKAPYAPTPSFMSGLTDIEIKQLHEGLIDAFRQNFTSSVLRTLSE